MLSSASLRKLTSGDESVSPDTPTLTLEQCEDEVSKKISNIISEVLKKDKKGYDSSKYTQITSEAISDYVKTVKPMVESFIDKETGVPQLTLLENALKDFFLGYGPLQGVINDPAVTEIQINDFDSIMYEKGGKLQRLMDPLDNTKPVSFGTFSKYRNWVSKLLLEDNKKLTEQNAVIDAISSTGMRINVVGQSATVADRDSVRTEHPINVTLRKQPKVKFTPEKLIGFGTMSRGISRVLELIPNAKLSTFVIGATGSGKTVIVNIMTDNIPNTMRVFAVGSPAELRLRRRDGITGEMLNNIIHTQATPWQGDIKLMPKGFPDTLNLIGAAYRVTPEIAIMEELRHFSEFEKFTGLATSGHCVFSTYHGESAAAAANRYLVEMQSANPSLSRNTIMDILASFLKFIIVQEKMADGTRKVVEVAEIIGTDHDATGDKILKLNYLYKFIRDREKPDPNVKRDAAYLKRPVKGAHYRVGCISKELEYKLIKAGFTEDQYGFLTKPLERDEDGNIIPEKDEYVYDPIFNGGVA